MKAGVGDQREHAPAPATDRPLKVLVALHYPGYLRYFASTLTELARRGHTVEICFDNPEKQGDGLVALETVPHGVTVLGEKTPRRKSREKQFVAQLRRTGNYLQYLHPRYRDAHYLRDRNADRLPRGLRWLQRIDSLPAPVVALGIGAVKRLDRAIPAAPKASSFLRSRHPDVLVVSPLIVGSSPQPDLVAAAQALGIPSGYAVGSWDHLTTKGILHADPDRVFVWNPDQAEEAQTIHGVPRSRIVVTGAQPFDKWFDRSPSLERAAFCAAIGLDPAKPIVLFVGSTASISAPSLERAFVARWLAALRADPRTAHANVIVRPHPYNSEQWRDVDLHTENAAVWPRGGANPADPRDQDVFFDSLYHASAIVGVNTSAMIEAAIVGRPVLTILDGDFESTQAGTLHFRYFLPEHGGYVQTATSFDAHIAQLTAALEGRDANWDRLRETFVGRFVRPLGPDRKATSALADGIESLAHITPAKPRRSWLQPIVKALLVS